MRGIKPVFVDAEWYEWECLRCGQRFGWRAQAMKHVMGGYCDGRPEEEGNTEGGHASAKEEAQSRGCEVATERTGPASGRAKSLSARSGGGRLRGRMDGGEEAVHTERSWEVGALNGRQIIDQGDYGEVKDSEGDEGEAEEVVIGRRGFADLQAMREAADFYVPILGLNHFRIELRVNQNSGSGDQSEIGAVWHSQKYPRAVVTIADPNALEPDGPWSYEDAEETLVHELVHLMLLDMEAFAGGKFALLPVKRKVHEQFAREWDRLLESLVERLALAIVAAARSDRRHEPYGMGFRFAQVEEP